MWTAWKNPPPLLWGCLCSTLMLRPASQLVEVDGADQHGANGDLLPERLHAGDHEPVLENGGDEHAEHGPEHGADAAEQARASDDHRGDGLKVVRVVTADRGRAEARQVHEARQTRERPG